MDRGAGKGAGGGEKNLGALRRPFGYDTSETDARRRKPHPQAIICGWRAASRKKPNLGKLHLFTEKPKEDAEGVKAPDRMPPADAKTRTKGEPRRLPDVLTTPASIRPAISSNSRVKA
jgi:hypothetical protein